MVVLLLCESCSFMLARRHRWTGAASLITSIVLTVVRYYAYVHPGCSPDVCSTQLLESQQKTGIKSFAYIWKLVASPSMRHWNSMAITQLLNSLCCMQYTIRGRPANVECLTPSMGASVSWIWVQRDCTVVSACCCVRPSAALASDMFRCSSARTPVDTAGPTRDIGI